ncbi:MAG: LysR family transcriptional regulator [Pseudomonadota bacterium]
MYWITLEQITCFQAVVEEGSFQKASQRLNKAKSAVMYSVKSLEEQLGFPIIDRSSYRSKITSQGEAFYYSSQKVLNSMAELQESCQQIANAVEMKLIMSVSGIFDMQVLYPIIKNAMNLFPSTEIVLEKEILSGEKMLNREMVDLAIFENLHNTREVEHKHIGTVKLMLVIAKDHPFLQLPIEQQTKSALHKHPQIIQRSTIANDDHNIGVHHNALQWKVTDTPSKKDIIKNGLGWGRLPSHIVENDIETGELIHLEHLKDDDCVEMFLCKRRSDYFGQVARLIWDSF